MMYTVWLKKHMLFFVGSVFACPRATVPKARRHALFNHCPGARTLSNNKRTPPRKGENTRLPTQIVPLALILNRHKLICPRFPSGRTGTWELISLPSQPTRRTQGGAYAGNGGQYWGTFLPEQTFSESSRSVNSPEKGVI